MELRELRKHWNTFGVQDPLWAVLTRDNARHQRWDVVEFFATGATEIATLMGRLDVLGLPRARRRALDFGCGVGRLTQALCRHFEESVGVDIAPSMIRLAKTYNHHGRRCHYRVNRAADLRRFGDNHFDLVYSNLVLQHMRPDFARAYVREFLRVVAPDGIVVFGLPSERWPTIDPPVTAIPEPRATSDAVAPTGDHEVPATLAEAARASGPMPDGAFSFRAVVDGSRRVVSPAESIRLTVEVKNTGTSAWPAHGAAGGRFRVSLGNHWLNKRGGTVTLDDARAHLTRDLAPLAATTLTMIVTAPRRRGHYLLELDMVQEGVAWFKTKGASTVRIPIEVSGANSWFSSFRALPGRAQRRWGWDAHAAAPSSFSPRMEMYGTEPEALLGWLNDAGADLVDLSVNPAREWPTYIYYVTRSKADVPASHPRLTSIPILPVEAFRAGVTVSDPPREVTRETDLCLSVVAKNLSTVTWPGAGPRVGKYEIRAANRWLDAEERTLVRDDGRARLEHDLSPGTEARFALWVRTPATAGPHLLEVDLLQEHVAWFQTFGSEPARVRILVHE
jgi:SAM-dependent methyltransferase